MTARAERLAPPAELVTGHVVGVDLGQAADYTAIAVARRVEPWPIVPAERPARVRFEFAHLERVTLGTTYPAIVARVREILAAPALRTREHYGDVERSAGAAPSVVPAAPALVVDATGVGRPVVDMLRAAKLDPVAVTITGGDRVGAEPGGGFRVPKRDLVGALSVLLQTGRLKIARTQPHAATLVDELLRFRVKINPATAHDSYGAEWREGAHDDLVLAAAVACWYGARADARRPFVPQSRSYPTLY